MYALIVLLFIILYIVCKRSYKIKESDKWIGGPTSHVPKPTARWAYNV